MKKILLQYISLLLFIFLFFSCNNEAENNYQGHHFTINFFEADSITNNDWIEIDGTRFNHSRYEKEVFSEDHFLPTSEIVRDSLNPEKKFVEPFNHISIAILFAKKISALHTDTKEQKYILSQKPLLMTNGILNFHKSDSSIVTIKTSEKYPAKITAEKFE